MATRNIGLVYGGASIGVMGEVADTVLAAGGDVVPASVQDAVLARVDELSSEARRAVELVSVVPTRLERDIARGILGGEDGQAEAEAAQLLTIRPEGVGFRHELARRAVESGLTGQVRRSLNEAVLAALEKQGADPARLVHHAAEAADDEAVVRHGLEAARSAAAALANRQALAHWSRVLEHEGMLTETQLEEALEGHSRAAYLSYENERALASREQLLAMHETGDPRARCGESSSRQY